MEGWPIFRGELLVSGRVCFVGLLMISGCYVSMLGGLVVMSDW